MPSPQQLASMKGCSIAGFLIAIMAMCFSRLHKNLEQSIDGLLRKTYQLTRASVAVILLVGIANTSPVWLKYLKFIIS